MKSLRNVPHIKSRLLVVGAIGALSAASLLSSCSSVRTDAAKVNGESLSRDSFETLLDGYADAIPTSRLPNGSVDISIARGLLTDWVTTRVLLAELTDSGIDVTDDDLAEARSILEPQPGFEAAATKTQDFYVLATAVRRVFTSNFGMTDAQAREAYESGTASLACLRGILTADQTAIDSAAVRLASGEDFATVASEVSTDSTKSNGGILSDQQGGKECLSIDSLSTGAPELLAALDGVAVGGNSLPFQLSSGEWVILHIRPYDEVASEVLDTLGTSTADDARIAAIVASDVSVSSEYGVWDPSTGTVTAR